MPAGARRSAYRRPTPGDEDGMVVVHELLPAHVAEVADPAVIDRPGIGFRGSGFSLTPVQRGQQPLA